LHTSEPASKAILSIAVCFLLAACQGILVHEVRSEYSHIQVLDYGWQRALVFAGDNTVETLIDRREPHRLQHPYARTVMAGLLYRPEASSCLLIGLGGGALVRFLDHYFPQVRLDVVEIDPAIVAVARDYFGTVPARVFVEDGREYLRRGGERYDLILIDAHLHPDARTDASGHPLTLKGEEFYRSVRERLRPGGVVMFNMLEGRDAEAYLEGIRAAFPALAVFRPSRTGNIIVFAALQPLPDDAELRARAQKLDGTGDFGFSFERLLEERKQGLTLMFLLRGLDGGFVHCPSCSSLM
jgi:spermidine synthase